MNLAEIRKKAEGAKKAAAAATVTETAAVPDVMTGIWSPEEELEGFAAEAEAVAAAEAEQSSSLPQLPPEPLEPVPADAPLPTTAAAVCREIAVGNDLSQNEAQSAAAVVGMSNSRAVLPGTAPLRAGYNPLATILSGREEAADAEESSVLQQQLLSAGDIEEYLCFRVADEEYALSIMAIKEIIKPREVTEVPRMPDFVSGVISLRGVIIPVMDMRLRLSLPVRGAKGRERIVVLRTDAGFCGVLVDEVVQVARIRKTDIEEPPAVLEEIDREFVRGLGHFDNRMIILLNLETIIDMGTH